MTHSAQTMPFRVTDAATPDAPGLVYSGDCGRADDLLPLIHEGDTVLCEAFWSTLEPNLAPTTLRPRMRPMSPDAEELLDLILTHILEAHDPRAALHAAEGIFPGSVRLAEPESGHRDRGGDR